MTQDRFFNELHFDDQQVIFSKFLHSQSETFSALAEAVEEKCEVIDLAQMRSALDGWGSFIYTSDNVDFYMRHRKAINCVANDLASELGEPGIVSLVRGFYGHTEKDGTCYSEELISKAISGRKTSNCDVNKIREEMTFFAVEEVANAFQNFLEELA